MWPTLVTCFGMTMVGMMTCWFWAQASRDLACFSLLEPGHCCINKPELAWWIMKDTWLSHPLTQLTASQPLAMWGHSRLASPRNSSPIHGEYFFKKCKSEVWLTKSSIYILPSVRLVLRLHPQRESNQVLIFLVIVTLRMGSKDSICLPNWFFPGLLAINGKELIAEIGVRVTWSSKSSLTELLYSKKWGAHSHMVTRLILKITSA